MLVNQHECPAGVTSCEMDLISVREAGSLPLIVFCNENSLNPGMLTLRLPTKI